MGKRTKDKRNGILSALCYIINSLSLILLITAAAYLQKTELSLYLRNLLTGLAAALAIPFSFYISSGKQELFFWNENHMGRYILAVVFSEIFLFCMAFFPFMAVPVSLVSVLLTVYSGGFTGMVSYLLMILLYTLVAGVPTEQMLVLLISGLFGVVLFKSLGREFRYAGALFAYLSMDFICYSFYYVMGQSALLPGDALLYMAIRLFAALVVLLAVLKLLGTKCIYRDDDFFALISDPEYELLSELKAACKDAYFHAVHTAYLSDKIAARIGANAPLTKAGGYYHKIGLLYGKDTIQNTILVGRANHFPDSLMQVLKEYGIKNSRTISREAAIVQLSDAVVSSISYLFLKEQGTVLDYDKIVDVIIKKKMESGDWDGCKLTIEEISEIKKAFAGEKLYYDFLR